MNSILAFAGSNSSSSINQQLVYNITDRLNNLDIQHLNLVDYPLPIYSVDIEKLDGFPENLKAMFEKIKASDALVVAVNEYNSAPSGFFKNIIDWLSRMDKKFLEGKKILLVSTSPGARGAKSALEYTEAIFARFGGNVLESFSFPSFHDNFQNGKVTNEVLDMGIQDVVTTFAHQIES